jgi:peptide deformylase
MREAREVTPRTDSEAGRLGRPAIEGKFQPWRPTGPPRSSGLRSKLGLSEIDLLVLLYYLLSMALRTIIKLPDPRLRLVSSPVTSVDDSIRALMDDMLETMYAAPGIGLAAIQIAVQKRVFVLDVAKREDEDAVPAPLCLANPEIIWTSEERSTAQEGCLSIPDVFEDVERPAHVRVRYLDRDGRLQETEAAGILATCIQHEIDHLNGVLFIDHVSRLKRELILRKYNKTLRHKAHEKKRDAAKESIC